MEIRTCEEPPSTTNRKGSGITCDDSLNREAYSGGTVLEGEKIEKIRLQLHPSPGYVAAAERRDKGSFTTLVSAASPPVSRVADGSSRRIFPLNRTRDNTAIPFILTIYAVLLMRGLEPPRVSPYGPEPYASAIPPHEQCNQLR